LLRQVADQPLMHLPMAQIPKIMALQCRPHLRSPLPNHRAGASSRIGLPGPSSCPIRDLGPEMLKPDSDAMRRRDRRVRGSGGGVSAGCSLLAAPSSASSFDAVFADPGCSARALAVSPASSIRYSFAVPDALYPIWRRCAGAWSKGSGCGNDPRELLRSRGSRKSPGRHRRCAGHGGLRSGSSHGGACGGSSRARDRLVRLWNPILP